MLLARYSVCVKTWIPHEVQCAVVGTFWKLARPDGTSNFLWLVPSFADWMRWLVLALLSLLSLKFPIEFKGKRIILGALQKDRCIVISSRPDECVSSENPFSGNTGAAERLMRERLEQSENRLAVSDRWMLEIPPDPANKKQVLKF